MSAYHPQFNSQAEVTNKTIAKHLRNVVNSTTLDWENYLAPLKLLYNKSSHRTIQTSPFFSDLWPNGKITSFQLAELEQKISGRNSKSYSKQEK